MQLEHCTIRGLAQRVLADWKNPSPYAVPYIRAMLSLGDITSTYGAEDAKSIVLYFLSNAAGWRGSVAKAVKTELKSRCGVK